MKNPFSIAFGKVPEHYISRVVQANEVLDDFRSEVPSSQVYMIMGIRGSGKTVLMTELAKTLGEEKDWIVVNLNAERDLLQILAAKLYEKPELKRLFVKARLDFSALGLGLSVRNGEAVADVETAIEKMLMQIKKQKRRLLITVDEITGNAQTKAFAAAFQIFIREELPVFMVMTGLYDNIRKLQDEKSMTFLYRAPKIHLAPLNIPAVERSYKRIFSVPDETAREMARMTKGYSFAFQVLGYLCWQQGKEEMQKDGLRVLETVLPQFDQYLEDYVYEKVWSECSELDRKIVTEMVKLDSGEIGVIREALQISPQLFYTYKKRLSGKGVIDDAERGRLIIRLPRFAEYVERMTI